MHDIRAIRDGGGFGSIIQHPCQECSGDGRVRTRRFRHVGNLEGIERFARAREAFRAWSWIAERRLPSYFGQKQEITHVSADLGDRLRRARERVIEGETLPSVEGPIQSKDLPSRG